MRHAWHSNMHDEVPTDQGGSTDQGEFLDKVIPAASIGDRADSSQSC